jgi:uncharacterized protein YdiU (UPF0061 family)
LIPPKSSSSNPAPAPDPAQSAIRNPQSAIRNPQSAIRNPQTAMPAPTSAGWNLDHSYTHLPELFFQSTLPVPVRTPRLAILNAPLATELGLDPEILSLPQHAGLFTGNLLPENARPIAQAYAGHQFGHFTGLGDGRAILLGEQITPDGRRFDIQLKGSGRTPYSRGGDGRAALGPMLREYLISEAMHALGIPTTRSLAVATTGEPVFRQDELPGAVLTRVAASHIRVGTFQWAAAHRDTPALAALAHHTRQRHYPEVPDDAPFINLFRAIIDRQAALIAKWLHVGFIHGVMNTDNTALSGETIDYGPCAFIDAYDPKTVFSSIDTAGRYAYDRQSPITRWNLARLAETLLPLIDPDEKQAAALANEALGRFQEIFHHHWLTGMRAKLGLLTAEENDDTLIQSLLDWMHPSQADFTNTFRALSSESALATPPFPDPDFTAWHARWIARLSREPKSAAEATALMRAKNPALIPRNHKVEEALAAASDHGDLAPFQRLLTALAHPFTSDPPPDLTSHAPADSPPFQTFCGT